MRFSPEFTALLRKRSAGCRQLSRSALYALYERSAAANAVLSGRYIFDSLSPGLHLRQEPLYDFETHIQTTYTVIPQ